MLQSRYNVALYTKIANMWLIFNVIMVAISWLPHWPIPTMSWITLSLYFLAFLLTLFIAIADEFSRDAYIPLSLLFFLYSLFLPVMLIGEGYVFGSNMFGWQAYRYQYLAVAFFLAFSIMYYSVKHALRPSKPGLLAAATILFVAAVFLYHFWHFLQPSSEFYTTLLFQKSITYYLLPVVAIFIYGLFNPFFKPIHGEYAHSIMSILALLSFRELVISISFIKGVFLFGADQVFLALALLALIFVLVKKLNFASSPAGKIYAQIAHQAIYIPNLKLEGRDRKEFLQFAAVVYFAYLRKNIIIPIFLIFVFLLKFINPPYIVRLNLLALVLVLFLVFLFLISAYSRKQNKDGFLITASPQNNQSGLQN
jgi:hypothetical protein